MIDWTKKVTKSCGGVLQPGEVLAGATLVDQPGAFTKAIAFGAGGAAGAALAHAVGSHNGSGGVDTFEATKGIADTLPRSKSVLAVTDQRFLVFGFGTISGRPKELQFEIARNEVGHVTFEKGKLASRILLSFADGSAVTYEAPNAGKPQEFADALGAA